jgi:hypothetical protein
MFGVALGDDLKTLPTGKTVERSKEGDQVLIDRYQGKVAELELDENGRVMRIRAELLISVERDGNPWLMDSDDYDIVEKKLEGVVWVETDDGIAAQLDDETALRMEFTEEPRFFVAAILERGARP